MLGESQFTLYVFEEWVSLYTTDAAKRVTALRYKLLYGAYKCLFIIALTIIFYLAYKSLV